MRIQKADRTPKYIQIYDWVHAMIRKGRFKIGDKIPTEPDLARQFNVSRMTVRKAIDPLVLEGVLERRPGKGTYVVSDGVVNITYDTSRPTRFFHLMEQLGIPRHFEVVDKKVVKAGRDLCRHLNLLEGQKAICLTVLLYADKTPVIIERNYYPYEEYKRLLDLEFLEPPLVVLGKEFNVQIKAVHQYISAVVAGEREMALFNIDYPIPCIYLEWISCGADDLPFSVSLCHYRGDSFKFKVPSCELVRSG